MDSTMPVLPTFASLKAVTLVLIISDQLSPLYNTASSKSLRVTGITEIPGVTAISGLATILIVIRWWGCAGGFYCPLTCVGAAWAILSGCEILCFGLDGN